jgi:hypothetical protein
VGIIVIGGSGKDVGKTALMCAVIASLREFDWTAVKITGHDYEAGSVGSGPAVREEMQAGQETDTGRYLAAGARRALLVTRCGDRAPIEEIRKAIGKDRNVIFESNRIVDVVKPDVCLALMGNGAERKASFERLLRVADAVVSVGEVSDVGMRRFRLESVGQLTAEMLGWLRERLS